MSEKRVSVFRYWASGIVFTVLAWIVAVPLMFFQGFFEFLMDEYGNLAIPFIYALAYIILVPLIFGVIIKWVSEKIF